MSGHERERLSAYLDGELRAAEREEVSHHLAGCAECAARLAELAAVDAAAAEIAAAAPDGYFEALPGRVRARLDRRATAWKLPAWGWAVAAALLLAVVTPLTTWRAAAPQLPARPQAAASRPAAPPLAPDTGATTSPSAAAGPTAAEPKAEAGRAAAAAAPTPLRRASAAYKDKALAPEAGFAAPPSAAADREQQAADATGRLQPAAPSAAPPAPAPTSGGTSASGALAQADTETAPPERRADERDSRARENEEKPRAKAALAAPGAQARIEERVAAASTPLTATEWKRLASLHPQSADEWRRLRAELRRFAEAAPDGAQAAAARLRAVEAAHSAWRASGDPADEAVFRADAQAYLQRDDARDEDKDRVRRLMR